MEITLTAEQLAKVSEILDAKRQRTGHSKVKELTTTVEHLYTCALCGHTWAEPVQVLVKYVGQATNLQEQTIEVSRCHACHSWLESKTHEELVWLIMTQLERKG